MDTQTKLKEAFDVLAQPALVLQPATIEAVSASDRSATLRLSSSGAQIENARLQSIIDADQSTYLLVTPAIGSSVLVAQMSGQWIVMTYSEIETISIKTATAMDLRVGNVPLGKLFNDLISACKGIMVTTPNGPSGPLLAPSTAAFNAVQNDLKNLLKTS